MSDGTDNFIDYQLIYVKNFVPEKNYKLPIDKVFWEIVNVGVTRRLDKSI